MRWHSQSAVLMRNLYRAKYRLWPCLIEYLVFNPTLLKSPSRMVTAVAVTLLETHLLISSHPLPHHQATSFRGIVEMLPLGVPDSRHPQDFSTYPIDDHYAGSPNSALQSSEASHRHQFFDGLPSFQTERGFLSVAASPSDSFGTNYNLPATMANQHDISAWDPRSSPLQELQHFSYPPYLGSANYHYNSPFDSRRSRDLLEMMDQSSVPRTSSSLYGRSLFEHGTETNLSPFPTEAFFQDPVAPHFSAYPHYDAQEGSKEFLELGFDQSHNSEYVQDSTQMASSHQDVENWSLSPGSDDGRLVYGETALVDFEDRHEENEEPYAKLIHKALMSTETHSMVLQDIYAWFRQNTNKGNSESKGWMNSIRHNLSMNAAFKKTERKVPGDETKKSTEWVLEDFAVKDGVQSTTRYRMKGSGSKKFYRSDAATTARQSSGRKGGLSTSKTKQQRHRVKDERSEPQRPCRLIELPGHPYMQQPPPRSTRFEHAHPASPSPKAESPPSPGLLDYRAYSLDGNPYADACSLENVHLVDTSGENLFSDNRDPYDYLDHHNQQRYV
ncbi:fork head domain-containing protein [Phlyctema vagabunda]|uniref:Fork head domain-containing protein n=1 Tax=Phlyctema vagabunda TaxID=108571 RepID=A0ABR4PQJ8_9HELO